MPLANRRADLVTVKSTDIQSAHPDAVAIQRLKEQAMAALGGLGFSSGEPT